MLQEEEQCMLRACLRKAWLLMLPALFGWLSTLKFSSMMLTAQTDHVVSCYACFGCAAGRRAVHVAGVPQEGMAVDVAGPSGLVEFTEDQLYDVDSRDDKQRIPFQLSEVTCKLLPLWE